MKYITFNTMLFFILIYAAVAACSQGLHMTSEQQQQEDENFVTLYIYDSYISDELTGEKPPGGVESWNTLWLSIFEELGKDPNDKKYIDYIIFNRATAGLPRLDGYVVNEEQSDKK